MYSSSLLDASCSQLTVYSFSFLDIDSIVPLAESVSAPEESNLAEME